MQIQEIYPDLNFVGECSDINSGKNLIENLQPKIIFTDMELPDGKGSDLLYLCNYNPLVFLITGHENIKIEKNENPHLHILNKPVDVDLVKNLINKHFKK